MGGYNGVTAVDEVEVLQLKEQDEQIICQSTIPPLPSEATFALGLTNSFGRPMVCGGGSFPTRRKCYVLEEDGNWDIDAYELLEERYFSAIVRLDDGRFWILGGEDDG